MRNTGACFSALFGDMKLKVEGRVPNAGNSYSLADLKLFPSRTQITRHTCERRVVFCHWRMDTGYLCGSILNSEAFFPVRYWLCEKISMPTMAYIDSVDLLDDFITTILAYALVNGRDLPVQPRCTLAIESGKAGGVIKKHEVYWKKLFAFTMNSVDPGRYGMVMVCREFKRIDQELMIKNCVKWNPHP